MDEFQGCTTQHWERYGDAVQTMDSEALFVLVRELEDCRPLQNNRLTYL